MNYPQRQGVVYGIVVPHVLLGIFTLINNNYMPFNEWTSWEKVGIGFVACVSLWLNLLVIALDRPLAILGSSGYIAVFWLSGNVIKDAETFIFWYGVLLVVLLVAFVYNYRTQPKEE